MLDQLKSKIMFLNSVEIGLLLQAQRRGITNYNDKGPCGPKKRKEKKHKVKIILKSNQNDVSKGIYTNSIINSKS